MKPLLFVLTLVLGLPAFAQEAENILVLDIAAAAGDGIVEIELLPDLAPQHVARVKELARAGSYDNVAFHRVIDGFMAQTGDVEFGTLEKFPEGMAGRGGSPLPDLPAEFSAEPFVTGTVGMARSQDPDSANSQFFIMFAEAPFLDGQYTVFGRVLSGQDVVDRILRGDEAANGMIAEDPDFIRGARIKADQGE
jgi:cyclophilin family peptidyl-prolyl cis-trans isomerase